MIGDWHNLNGYTFRETLHGPMVWGTCVDCDIPALEVQPTGRVGEGGLEEDTGGDVAARCSTCGRTHHGAGLDYYGTGRGALYRRVESPELDRLRRLANERKGET